jgi:uncharacterized protein YdeI (YjbR/CyaY-like superfamily)
MGTKDKRIDAYIAKANPFARPILKHIRELVHKACPDVEETWKWSFPHFVYEGSTICSMAAFKAHCAFGFWKASLLKDPHKILAKGERDAMGHFGRLTSLADLPPDKIMIEYIKEAAKLNKEGVKIVKKPAVKEKKVLETPDYMLKALAKNKKASQTFEMFSPSHKKEYIEWLVEAKTDETRNKRLSTAIEWMSEGKPRMWKYIKK